MFSIIRKLEIQRDQEAEEESKPRKMKLAPEETRKGPWTEQEDILLINFVHLFGDRRWDFIAKVSGLNRTGKSCRLRWVNYLHPGLKSGKMTPQEEKLVLELHAKWGNRWSRIARKLPGRTDNEIKNYWRTHMRKKAQEGKRAMSLSSSSSNCCSSSSITTATNPFSPFPEAGEAGFYDTGGITPVASAGHMDEKSDVADQRGYSMDDIWKDIETTMEPESAGLGCNLACLPMASPTWQYFPDTLWRMEDGEASRMLLPFEHEATEILTG